MARMSAGLLELVFATYMLSPAAGAAAQVNEPKSGPQVADAASPKKKLREQARLASLRKAQIWAPTLTPELDLRAGPSGPGAFQPNEMVTCDYVEIKLSGSSRKFECAVSEGDVVKVRYGTQNGEVQGAVLATRLLWALGFGADPVYPVRVRCRGCSADPWTKRERTAEEHLFDPAAIERRPAGREINSKKHHGWSWPELDLVDDTQGGAPRAQRDALKLLAVLLQHTDNKPQQQRLLCLSGSMSEDGACDKPFLMLHDVGLTFGRANFWNRSDTGSVNFQKWSRTPVWRDASGCIGHLTRSTTGTLGDPRISEDGRQFLADLLAELTDQQLHDLFAVGRVEVRSREPGSSKPGATVDEWVDAFKHKREEIVTNRCSA